MPYKSEKIKIAHTEHDRRIKLDGLDHVRIKSLYDQGYSIRALSREFKVDRNIIKCIIDPSFKKRFYEQNKARLKKYRELKHYDNAYRAKSMRNTRQYKQKLYVKGKIKNENK